jgi:hypothetical protein
MSFQECEYVILKNAIDESLKIQGERVVNNEETRKILKILVDYLIDKRLVCYGGTAVNNILPKKAQFYNTRYTIPDYDVYSDDALEDAKKLTNIFYNKGFTNVVAKSAVHYGTYKVYVNFIPILDVTQLYPPLFKKIQADAIKIAGIYYCPPNFLRMNMFIELSRPMGDVSRWEKILQRLTLLNKHYPLNPGSECNAIDFHMQVTKDAELDDKIYIFVRDVLIDVGVVFFGGYASMIYSKHMTRVQQKQFKKIPNFDVIYDDIEKCAKIIMDVLRENEIRNVEMKDEREIGEMIPRHIIISVNKQPIVVIYEPIACHNYNVVTIGDKEVNIATIDTILSFYLGFYYIDKPYYDHKRILCLADYLFRIEQKKKIETTGLLKRFSTTCYGKQKSLDDIRLEKYQNYEELKHRKTSKEYESWFLNYTPKPIEKMIANIEQVAIKEGVEKETNRDIVPNAYIDDKKKIKELKQVKYEKKHKTHKKRQNKHNKTRHHRHSHDNDPHMALNIYS